MTYYREVEFESACTRLGAYELCSACKRSQDSRDPNPNFCCYREGAEVEAIVRQRERWQRREDLGMNDQKVDLGSFSDILKSIYGPQYEGPYKDTLLAKELSRYESRRYRLAGGPKPRKWKDICVKLGLVLGQDPFYKLFYAKSPLFGLLRKD